MFVLFKLNIKENQPNNDPIRNASIKIYKITAIQVCNFLVIMVNFKLVSLYPLNSCELQKVVFEEVGRYDLPILFFFCKDDFLT